MVNTKMNKMMTMRKDHDEKLNASMKNIKMKEDTSYRYLGETISAEGRMVEEVSLRIGKVTMPGALQKI